MKAHSLETARPLYVLPADDLAEEVLVPAFLRASRARVMVGFFSSRILAEVAPGLATYANRTTEPLDLIISPYLTDEDRSALASRKSTADEIAVSALQGLTISSDDLQLHTLRCMVWLLERERLRIQVALMREALFHPKVWLFDTPQGTVAVHGSSNMTYQGVRKNFEQVSVSKAWEDATQRYVANKLSEQFDRLWARTEPDCLVVPLPEAIERELVKSYRPSSPPTEDDFRRLYDLAAQAPSPVDATPPVALPARKRFEVPAWLKIDEGAFAHQGRAVEAWSNAGFRGILEMATGSGKTLTSLVGAYRLSQVHSPLLVVVAAPYRPLITQWVTEIKQFGVQPINLTESGSARQRASDLAMVKRRLAIGGSRVEVVVVSHDTLCTEDFVQSISGFAPHRLLIADEAHNLGRTSFIASPPDCFEHRLALSATPVRQYDEHGTTELFKYFGDVVFGFTLEQAIGHCLVEYDYFVHPVELTGTEMDEWSALTARIRQNAWRSNDGKPDEYLSKLLRDRRALLEAAENKVGMLATLLDRLDRRTLKHTLIYVSDKSPNQMIQVNSLLDNMGILFHQLTYEETVDASLTASIIQSFQAGEIQVLTAKRVLDEGVNIPQICRAYILASTTVERQWVQRRGRLLRQCSATGKTHSEIHDLVALPPQADRAAGSEERAVMKSELNRVREFARLARNAGRPDGPLGLIDRIEESALG